MGRKRRAEEEMTKHVACELPRAVAQALKIEACRREITQKDLVREIITQAIHVEASSPFGDRG